MSNAQTFPTILVTGGGGYVGSALVPALLKQGHKVRVVDTFWYGENVFADCNSHPALTRIAKDIRDTAAMKEAMRGVDAVIHLACISNDPSFELDPKLGKGINLDAFPGLVEAAKAGGVKRFIYASSSSVYGVKEQPDVREDDPPAPLTDYSRFKLECEKLLMKLGGGMTRVIVRPATVCGYAPRLRLDLTVNILTIHALVNRKIRIFGGRQMRPNLHVLDMVRAYEMFLAAPAEKIDGVPFNVGFRNETVENIAGIVKRTIGDEGIALEYVPTDDNRSYHVNSDRVRRVLGFEPKYNIEDAVRSIVEAYRAGKIPDPMTNPMYHNIKRMHQLSLG
ncbi:MAG TPA: NAD-dependent epimerase/dehydratase [Kiritimatiellia bacterium]|nr:NAD-dependent epimerase/dehydratase [Kiritimatiellia bacterium]HRZ11842.1 NAD-dependent epimerase/dehydratase [Kiritimatiellia bacterium]HSA17352.1 NAD-dependent epimerase/dehydratase [Kiritimatiellia bacterium]